MESSFRDKIESMRLAKSGAGLESSLKRLAKLQGYNVMRSGSTGLPDFHIDYEDGSFHVECKCYRTCDTIEQALVRWKKKQKSQYKKQHELSGICRVYLLLHLKDKVRLIRL